MGIHALRCYLISINKSKEIIGIFIENDYFCKKKSKER